MNGNGKTGTPIGEALLGGDASLLAMQFAFPQMKGVLSTILPLRWLLFLQRCDQRKHFTRMGWRVVRDCS